MILERIRERILPDLEIEKEGYLSSLPKQDRQNLEKVVEWLEKQVGDDTAIWAVGSSVREAEQFGELRRANDLDLRLFTDGNNEKVNQSIRIALKNNPPSGFEVRIEPSHRDFSTAYNGRLWSKKSSRPVNIISPSWGSFHLSEEQGCKKWPLFHGGPFCELKKASPLDSRD